MKIKNNKSSKGITLIALIITIIIMLILVAVTVSYTVKSGLLNKTKEAKVEYSKSEIYEKLGNLIFEVQIEKKGNATLKDIVEYMRNDKENEYIISTSKIATISGNIPNIKNAKQIYVLYKGYQFKIDNKLKIEFVNQKNNQDDSEDIMLSNNSLLGKIAGVNETGIYNIEINATINSQEEKVDYNVHLIQLDGDVLFDGVNNFNGITLSNNVYEVGNKDIDVATESENAQNIVVLKINGNLEIKENIKLTACKSEKNYGGPKGFLIYCDGTIINNGTISMSARGAKAEGENVYLWNNCDGTFEYIPKEGAQGGDEITVIRSRHDEFWQKGNDGIDGTNRATGGGGTGAITSWGYSANLKIAKGGNGTSYSGGCGSGAIVSHDDSITRIQESLDNISGKAGDGYAVRNNIDWTLAAGGGAGNPGGTAGKYAGGIGDDGESGTGGLLIIYSETINNNGTIESNGCNGGNGNGFLATGGGASGGGSINIFYFNYFNNNGNIQAKGGTGGTTYYSWDRPDWAGGNGGDGTITTGSINNVKFNKD